METTGAAWVFSFSREEADMNWVRSEADLPQAGGSVIGSPLDSASAKKGARSDGIATTRPTTCARPIDLDLLRLSYVCLANTLLQNLPERSLILSRIHGFFDTSPDPASIERFSLSGLVEGERGPQGSPG
jgi:hypothetical protein